MRAFHAHGIVNRVSLTSISTMIVLFWLWENTDFKSLNEPRLLTAMALEQMRIMVEEADKYPAEDIAEIRGGGLFWAILVGESAASAHNGRMLQISSEYIFFIKCICF
jgi:hypothetical protein